MIVQTLYAGCTHTLCRSDVNRAGDVGEALIHAHLQVDHPANKHKLETGLLVQQKKRKKTLECTSACTHTFNVLFQLLYQLAPGCHTFLLILCPYLLPYKHTNMLLGHKANVSKEVKEFSTHRRNLCGSDPDLSCGNHRQINY